MYKTISLQPSGYDDTNMQFSYVVEPGGVIFLYLLCGCQVERYKIDGYTSQKSIRLLDKGRTWTLKRNYAYFLGGGRKNVYYENLDVVSDSGFVDLANQHDSDNFPNFIVNVVNVPDRYCQYNQPLFVELTYQNLYQLPCIVCYALNGSTVDKIGDKLSGWCFSLYQFGQQYWWKMRLRESGLELLCDPKYPISVNISQRNLYFCKPLLDGCMCFAADSCFVVLTTYEQKHLCMPGYRPAQEQAFFLDPKIDKSVVDAICVRSTNKSITIAILMTTGRIKYVTVVNNKEMRPLFRDDKSWHSTNTVTSHSKWNMRLFSNQNGCLNLVFDPNRLFSLTYNGSMFPLGLPVFVVFNILKCLFDSRDNVGYLCVQWQGRSEYRYIICVKFDVAKKESKRLFCFKQPSVVINQQPNKYFCEVDKKVCLLPGGAALMLFENQWVFISREGEAKRLNISSQFFEVKTTQLHAAVTTYKLYRISNFSVCDNGSEYLLMHESAIGQLKLYRVTQSGEISLEQAFENRKNVLPSIQSFVVNGQPCCMFLHPKGHVQIYQRENATLESVLNNIGDVVCIKKHNDRVLVCMKKIGPPVLVDLTTATVRYLGGPSRYEYQFMPHADENMILARVGTSKELARKKTTLKSYFQWDVAQPGKHVAPIDIFQEY